jgi:hypothetical protein
LAEAAGFGCALRQATAFKIAGNKKSAEDDLVRILFSGLVVLVVLIARASPAGAQAASARVAVQPLDGTVGPPLRQQITRLVRGHGFQVLTSIPRVQGTSQYPEVARNHRLAAFVTCDLEEHRARQTLTILIWDGAHGDVLGRWSASGSLKALSKALAKNFWKRLGPALERAQAPVSTELEEAPPMRIDAGSAID